MAFPVEENLKKLFRRKDGTNDDRKLKRRCENRFFPGRDCVSYLVTIFL